MASTETARQNNSDATLRTDTGKDEETVANRLEIISVYQHFSNGTMTKTRTSTNQILLVWTVKVSGMRVSAIGGCFQSW